MTTLTPMAPLRPFARTAARAALAGVLLLDAATAGAQQTKPRAATPPPARPTLSATAPLLVPPTAPPPPVAGKAVVVQRATAPAVTQQVKVEGFPVASVRPDSTAAVAPDPKFAPLKSATPPAPRAISQVQAAATRASAAASAQVPIGASARCKDGTFVFASVDAGTCESNGGLAFRMPAAPPTPPAPLKRPTP